MVSFAWADGVSSETTARAMRNPLSAPMIAATALATTIVDRLGRSTVIGGVLGTGRPCELRAVGAAGIDPLIGCAIAPPVVVNHPVEPSCGSTTSATMPSLLKKLVWMNSSYPERNTPCPGWE